MPNHLNELPFFECRIILPTTKKDKETLVDPSVSEWLQSQLIEKFGGYTAFSGWGGYTMHDGTPKTENVVIYDVAIRGNRDYNKLVILALGILRRADQETVYIRDPYGRVYIGSTAMDLTGGRLG